MAPASFETWALARQPAEPLLSATAG
jgi:hypothetical protein